MKLSNFPLDHEFTGLFRGVSRDNFPYTGKTGTGILINVDGLHYDDGVASFNVLVAYRFPRPFVECFHKIEWSLVLTIDDIPSGRGLALKLRDPHKRYPHFNGGNYTPSVKESVSDSYVESYLEVPLAIEVAKPRLSPSIFLSVTLHKFQSNRIGLDLLEAKVFNFMKGKQETLEILSKERHDEG